jgi:hypothetical protein
MYVNRTEQDWFDPDGLTVLDVYSLSVPTSTNEPQPTSALADGTAFERRERREAQRLLGATVRVLRVYGPLSVSTGTEAA